MNGRLVPGAVLFELKATHGFPLDFALDEIINTRKRRVAWAEYIEAARANGRWDFHTLRDMHHALTDADVPRDYRDAVMVQAKRYVVEHPHPALA